MTAAAGRRASSGRLLLSRLVPGRLAPGLVAGLLVALPAYGQRPADDAAQAAARETVPQRATLDVGTHVDALLGLARVARDAGDHHAADRYFTEADRVRPLDGTVRREHFWVMAEVDPARAMRAARALADIGLADEAVFERWLGLARRTRRPQAVAEAASRAQQAVPGAARWPRRLGESLLEEGRAAEAADAFARAAAAPDGTTDDVAMQALALERAGAHAAAAEAWQRLPVAVRQQHADWWASDLRTRAVRDGRAAHVEEFVRFVERYPADETMRTVAVEALADAQRPADALALLARGGRRLESPALRRREAELALAAGQTSRALALYRALEQDGAASIADRWQLAELAAPHADPQETITRLRGLAETDAPCGRRSLTVSDLATSDDVAAWVASARPPGCAMPARLALAAARWLVARDAPAQAEALLERARVAEPASTAVVLGLVERRLARGDADGADALLRAHRARPDAVASFDVTAAQAWVRAAQGHPAEAWAIIRPALQTQHLSPADAARWAGLALIADADADADRLARTALDSSADVDARHVLASLAQRRGDPTRAHAWLRPVVDALVGSRQLIVWLDALADVRGPAAALDEGQRRWSVPARPEGADVELGARLARWAAAAGNVVAADRYLAGVRAGDARRAERLLLERRMAEGHADEVVSALLVEGVTALEPEALRLLVTAALDSDAWPTAETALATWTARGLDADWARLKAAELAIKRDGRLPADLRQRLVEASAHPSGTADEVRIRLAQDSAARGAYEDALARLGPIESTAGPMPLAVRRALVDILADAGRPADVLAALPPIEPWPADLQAARARALVASARPHDALAVLEQIPVTQRRADDWRLLASLTDPLASRAAVLEQALVRLSVSQQAPVLAALAGVHLQLGRLADARDAAVRAHAIDGQDLDAWRVRLAVRPGASGVRSDELLEADRVVGARPDAAIDLAEAAMAGGVPDDTEAATLRRWLDAGLHAAPARALRLRIRLAVATGDWPVALAALAEARAASPDDPGLWRLDAQVHAWSGDHPEAARRFAAYLEAVPGDGSAWREYGRLLSWKQQATASQAAYARAAQVAPEPALEAERQTKAALARQAWRTAAEAAAVWLAREPDSLDARMDRAQALDRAGDVQAASRLYGELATVRALPHDLRAAARRYTVAHRPSGTLEWVVDAAEGFAGQQRLAQRVATASVADRVGPGGALRLSASVGRGVVDARTAAWDLTTVRTAADGRLGGWRVAGMAAVGWLSDAAGLAAGDAARSVSTVQADVARDLGDVLRVGAQVERRPFWENGATVRAGIMASGAGAHAELRPAPAWTVQGRASAHALDDGNRRHEAGAVLAWRTSRGDRDLEVRSSSMLFGYRDSSPLYFSPSRFVRSDLEAEVRHWFSRPRSADAPRAFVAGGLGMGIDSREARYGLGSARLSVPLARIWTLEAEGRWVQASAYESSRVGLWLQVGR